MTLILINFLVLLCYSFVECQQFRYDYKFNNDVNGWIKHHIVPATWEDARFRCQLEGAILASPRTINLATAMIRTIGGTHSEHTGVYTGIHATFSKGDFHSVDGVPIGRMPVEWMPYEPDNVNNDESCIIMAANGTIADVNCFEVYPYICYRENIKPIALTECGTVDTEYKLEPRTGSCYKFHPIARNWTKAFMVCSAEGGHLAIINSPEEATILAELFAKYPPEALVFTRHRDSLSLGFHGWGQRVVWDTIHGQTVKEAGYSRFFEGQPDEYQGPQIDCGGMSRNGKLDDVWCDDRLAFICEKTVDSLLEENTIDSLYRYNKNFK